MTVTTTGGGLGAPSSAPPIPTNEFYVAADGDDEASGLLGTPWQTSAKVNAYEFSPGDKVLFNGGETFDPLALSASGELGGYITVASYGTGQAIIDASDAAEKAVIANGQTYINFTNLDLRGGTAATAMLNAAYVNLYNCTITGNGSSSANGVSLFTGADHNIISGCTIHGHICLATGGAGIFASAATNLTLTGNTVYECGDGTDDHGIYITNCDYVSVTANYCHHNTGHGIQIQDGCTYTDVWGNKATYNDVYGIFVGSQAADNHCTFVNNIAAYNGSMGIFIGQTAYTPVVAFNTVVNNGTSGSGNGVYLGCAAPFTDNIVFQDASVVGNCRPLRIETSECAANCDYNCYMYTSTSDWNSTTIKMTNQSAPAAGYTFTELQALSCEANGMFADPVFVTDYTNLHLDTGSPVIGEGVAVDGVSYDYDGVTRGTPPDMGAFEYV